MSIKKVWLFSFIVVLSTASCAKDWFTTYNGNMPSNERIAQVALGQSKEDVYANLGAPSNIVSLDRNVWIYMSAEVKRIAFLKPEEVQRDILTIRFNDENKVDEIQRLSRKDGKTVAVSTDETETLGNTPGFFERYFGGVGTYMPFGGNNNSQM